MDSKASDVLACKSFNNKKYFEKKAKGHMIKCKQCKCEINGRRYKLTKNNQEDKEQFKKNAKK